MDIFDTITVIENEITGIRQIHAVLEATYSAFFSSPDTWDTLPLKAQQVALLLEVAMQFTSKAPDRLQTAVNYMAVLGIANRGRQQQQEAANAQKTDATG